MRSNILSALLTATTCALAACAGEQPAPQPPPMPAAPPPAMAAAPPADPTPPAPLPKPALSELIDGSLKATHEGFNAHDPAKMATALADDVVVADYGTGETHGKGDFQNGMGLLFSWFSDAKLSVDRVWKKGNVAITELSWAGTMTADAMGMKATHKPVGQMRLHVYWFNDDGLIKELHEYADDAGLMAQMQDKKGAPPVPMLATNPPDVHVASGTADEDKLGEWAKGIEDAFNKDDAKAALAGMGDDADYWLNVSGMPATKGKKNLGKELTAWFHSFPDQQWTTTQAWGIDGFGIVEHSMTGTFKGPLGPVHPTGKKVTAWHQVDILQPSADGKVQHGWGYGNMVEMLAQAGALPMPGGGRAHGPAKAQAAGGAHPPSTTPP
jgi:ketosteroid isomerase-like protein